MSGLYGTIGVILLSAAAVGQNSATLNAASPPSSPTSPGTQAPSPLVVQAVTGGADSATGGTAGQGSSPSITTGDGGAGTGTNTTGGPGGNLLITTGSGGASTGTAANSSGGNVVITLGQQGTGGSGAAGSSGQVQITASAPATQAGTGLSVGKLFRVSGVTGGASSGTGATAGTGSAVGISTGAGGTVSGSGTNVVGGAGGSLTMTTGAGGASNGTAANANGGSVVITTGTGGSGGSGNNGNGGDVVLTLGVAGTGGSGTAGRGGALLLPTGTVGSPVLCPSVNTSGICLYWVATNQSVLAWRDCNGGAGGGLCPSGNNIVSAGMDDQGIRVGNSGAIRFTNDGLSGSFTFNNGGLTTANSSDGTLSICGSGSSSDPCATNDHGGNLYLTNLKQAGMTTIYNATNTAGLGLPAIYGATSQKSESGADSNLLTFTPPATAGTYEIKVVLSVSAATSATFGWTATWKDSNSSAQSPSNLSVFKSGTAAPALTFTTTGDYYGQAIIDVDNSATNIVVKTTFSGTSISYKASATVQRLQ